MIGDGERIHAQLFGAVDQRANRAGAVKQAEVAMAMEMNKRRRGHGGSFLGNGRPKKLEKLILTGPAACCHACKIAAIHDAQGAALCYNWKNGRDERILRQREFKIMTLHGHIENGMIVLDDPLTLPDGAAVQVEIFAAQDEAAANGELPTLAETLKDFIGILEDLPDDAATNHDHYLYGTPKKS
jgi:hypothetical protein